MNLIHSPKAKALALVALLALVVWVATTGTSPTGLLVFFTVCGLVAYGLGAGEEESDQLPTYRED